MTSHPQRYTSSGGFGNSHGFEEEGGEDEHLDIDFSITESGRTVAHLIANMKDQGDEMDFSITDSGRSMIENLPEKDMNFGTGRASEGTRTRSASKEIPTSELTSEQQRPHSNSFESTGSGFVSGLMNATQGNLLSHTPPTGSSYETRHFGKRPRASSVSGRLRSASELEDKGIIDRNQKGVLKDLIISGDEALQEALEKYEKGDKSQLESMIKSGLLSQKLPADLDLLGELDLDFLTVDDATIGSMGHQNVEAHGGLHNARPKAVISFPSSSGNSVGGHSQFDEGIDGFDFGADLGDNESYLRYNSRSNSIDLDSYRLRSNSLLSASVDGRDRSNSLAFPDGRSRSNSLALNDIRERSNSLALNNGRDRANSLAYGALQHEPSANDAAAAAANQRWMDRPVAGKGDELDLGRGPNPPVAVTGIGASLAEYNNRSQPKLTKAEIAEEKRHDRQTKKEQKDREKQELKDRKDRERQDKRNQKEREKTDRKTKKTHKAKPKEEEPEEGEERIIQSGTGRPRSMSDPNLRSTIDASGLLEVERPDGWVGAYSPDSRKMRIARFMEKRNHRVWTKSVKYDVRKNFADSRLRVKGRFVKKEDELLMRELMSLT